MNKLELLINRIQWQVSILMCLILGLAPFNPPHIVEKLKMLFTGFLNQPADIFDILFHGTPWIVLIMKMVKLSNIFVNIDNKQNL